MKSFAEPPVDPELPTDSDSDYARRVGWYFMALTGLTWVLIVLGAVVRAHGAGLACPDWPYCFGSLLPRMDFRVLLEWGHRALAGALAILFAGVSALALRRPGIRSRVGGRIAFAAGLLAAQIVLGGLTVLHLLAEWSVVAHLVTGNSFCLVLLLTARALLGFGDLPRPVSPLVRGFVLAAAFTVAVQIILGGLVASSYAGLACPDWPACDGGRWFPTFSGLVGLQIAHRLGAYAVTLLYLGVVVFTLREAVIGNLARMALSVVFFQILIGVMNVLLRLPVEVTALHSATATLLVLVTALIVRAALAGPAGTVREAGIIF